MTHDERERLRTYPLGTSSVFDVLPRNLQLWDNVASRQRGNDLHGGSAPFAANKARITQHRLEQRHDGMILCYRRPHVHSPFWSLEDVVQNVPFTTEKDGDTEREYLCPRTQAPVSPTVA